MISSLAFLSGGGQMGALMRAHDWTSSPLGQPESWPQALQTTVSLLINSKFPMFIAWGEELGFLYNDAYAEILAAKHPAALGRPFREIWAEIWSDINPMIEAALAGEATYNENLPLVMNRSGFSEETWFTFSYSPVRDEHGQVAGMFCAVAETTKTVRSERRQAFRLNLEERLRGHDDTDQITAAAAEALGRWLAVARVGYGEIDEAQEHVIVARDWTDGSFPSVTGRHRLEDFGPPIISELKSGRAIAVDDVATDPRVGSCAASFAAIGTRSVLAVPLVKSGRFTAMLFLHHPEPRQWSAEDTILVTEVAERTWAAVERGRAQQALAASEALARQQADELTAIYNAAPVGLCVLDRDLRYVRINDRLAEINGVPAAAHLGCTVREVIPDLNDQAVETMHRVLEGEEVWGVEFVGATAAEPDVVRTWRENWLPLRNADGTVVGVTLSAEDITGAKAADRALHESEARFRNMADHAPVMMWVTNSEAQCVYLNRAWYEFTGQSPAEAEGLGWLNAIHPDDRGWSGETFMAASERQEAFRLEYRLRRHDGVFRWAIDAASPRLSAEGEFLGFIGSVIDIHDRKLAEQELEDRVAAALAERKLFSDVVEGTDALVQVLAPDFKWLAINKAAADELERLYGKRPAVGDTIFDVVAGPLYQQERVRSWWTRALAGEAYTEIGEFGEAGERRSFEMKFSPLVSPAGELIGAYQFVYDVTERVREQARLAEAEEARREADALYRTYFENTPEALFVIRVEPDGGFVVEQTNPAHEAGVGFRLDEVRGKRMEEFLPAAAAERILRSYREVVATGEILQYREVYELHGRPRHWDTSLVPMRDDSGRIVRIMGSSRDVTAQVTAEEALRHSQKMEAMGQLTGGVAHDFNNLLTPIVGSLDLLQRKGLGGEREQRLIAAAALSADRAKLLVQRLLAFARRQPLQPVAVNVANLVGGMADLIASTTGPQIKVVVDAAPDLPAAIADPNQLEMAVLNLAVNARDAMPDGGTLRISVAATTVGWQDRSELNPGQYVQISVADTGVGMDSETLARAVEPFFSTKGVGKGTGLGLSMVHGLAVQLGGTVTIHSTPGVGTNVELWLPQGDAAVTAAEDFPKGPEAAVRRGVALLVDDEDVVRLSTADMLIELGYDVIEASSAEEALKLLGQGASPQLLVTDHLMPGMSGTDLARTVLTDRPALKVLVISGYAESAGIAPDLPRLAKPFRKSDLAESLANQ